MRKTLTKAGFHHPKSNVHRLYVARNDGGRGIKILWDTYNEECSKLATYPWRNIRGDPLTTLISQLEMKKPKTVSILRFEEEEESLVKKHASEHLEGWKEMELHGQWLSERNEMSMVHEVASDYWLKHAKLTPETESLLVAAQEQTLATNYIRKKLWKLDCSPLCRLCKQRPENCETHNIWLHMFGRY